ncbi:hypothetical protein J2Y03_001047 [Neobacillus niacini]|uniref:hypothetical protein n=1 Tax=Neobacillus niacini TaxID=86668 RepID=UPI00285DEB8B|nr:hypothetical protein [Neobacillus niacini]MDR7076044.1 hypothetical protein [Neobacillus niacini]
MERARLTLYQFLVDFEASGDQFAETTGFEATPLDQALTETVEFWKNTKFK